MGMMGRLTCQWYDAHSVDVFRRDKHDVYGDPTLRRWRVIGTQVTYDWCCDHFELPKPGEHTPTDPWGHTPLTHAWMAGIVCHLLDSL